MQTSLQFPYPRRRSGCEAAAQLCKKGGAGLFLVIAVLDVALHCKIIPTAHCLQRSAVTAKQVRHQRFGPTVPFHQFLEEFQRGLAVACIGHKPLQYFAFVIDSAPQVMCLALDLDENLVQLPSPVPTRPHPVHAFAPDFSRKPQAKLVPPEPHSLISEIAPPFVQHIFDVE
jgi:hypothetical protein